MNRKGLTSPTPWIAAGMGLVVGLVCLLMRSDEGFACWLQESYRAQGFPAMSVLAPASPFSLLSLMLFTFGGVLALEGTPGTGRRMMLLLSGLVVIATASPVLALWGLFWSPLVALISILWAGIAVMVHASSRERSEALRVADERNVVRMNPPRSPRNRRLK